MNQQVGFKKYVAIDWSGAKKPINTPTIQVAEYVPATGIVSLRHPPEGTPGDLWSREAVVDYVQQTVNAVDEGPVLIGFDFAFANPYCDQSTYFPGAVAPPQNYQALWRAVEQQCNGFGNFYGAPFFRNPCSPYRQFYRYPGFRDNHYATRFRITEQAAAAQVRTGSRLGLPLHRTQAGWNGFRCRYASSARISGQSSGRKDEAHLHLAVRCDRRPSPVYSG